MFNKVKCKPVALMLEAASHLGFLIEKGKVCPSQPGPFD